MADEAVYVGGGGVSHAPIMQGFDMSIYQRKGRYTSGIRSEQERNDLYYQTTQTKDMTKRPLQEVLKLSHYDEFTLPATQTALRTFDNRSLLYRKLHPEHDYSAAMALNYVTS